MKNISKNIVLYVSLASVLVMSYGIISYIGIMPEGMANKSEPMPDTVTKDQFLESMNRVHEIRGEQYRLEQKADADSAAGIAALNAELESHMQIMAIYEESRKSLYVIPPQQKAELETIELDVRNKVAKFASDVGLDTYGVNLNSLTRTIEIVTPDDQYDADLKEIISTYPEHISFSIEHQTFEDEACSRQHHDCDPIVGGIRAANHDYSFSLGLPVQKNWLEYGFIVAGHSAANGSSLYQPSLSNSYKIGVDADSRYISDCDCAYVKKST